MKKYVDVILPLPLPRSFTYSLSDDSAEDIEPGCRVVVPFGRKKFYTAIVCNVHYKPLPMMTAYRKLGFDIRSYPNAYNYFANEITLPLHTKLSDADVEYIILKYSEVAKIKN